MRDPEEFDAFYAHKRTLLLLQAYALTGDLPAAQSAVRDTFIAAWHHWRKVSAWTDPEEWVRPQVWRQAHRRHTARVWHRDRSDDPEAAATLEALGSLSTGRRRLLLLDQLTDAGLGQMAREAGSTPGAASRELTAATTAYAQARGVDADRVLDTFEPLMTPVAAVSWPQAGTLRRAGTARRRTHTVVGAAATLAVTLAAGLLVAGPEPDHPTLADARLGGSLLDAGGGPRGSFLLPLDDTPEEEVEEQLSADDLLAPDQLERLARGRTWDADEPHANTEGTGLVVPCQEDRFADDRGRGSFVREYVASKAKGEPPMRTVQITELSATRKRARATFSTARGWFAGCTQPRVQLLEHRRVANVGDEASLLVLRSWRSPERTWLVGTARTGKVTTTTFTDVRSARTPGLDPYGGLLAAAVNALCGSPGAGTCAAPPALRPAPVPPTGMVPGMLDEVDMPRVNGVRKPWVGTEPRRASQNVASSQCDSADFSGAGVSNALTRTFVIPQATLPPTFGLTETVGTLPPRRARAFVEKVREQLASCPDREAGTQVRTLASRRAADRDLLVWRLAVEVADDRVVPYFMAVVRDGTAVAQIGFYPDGQATTGARRFVTLAERAKERLPMMPGPDRGNG
jgi:DNA-directed RNA polymerase specialized sigma24 family protein